MIRRTLQYKILLVLLSGVTLSLSPSPRAHYRIYRALARELSRKKDFDEWSEEKIRQSLYRINKNEYMQNTITYKTGGKFSVQFKSTTRGKEVLKKYTKENLVRGLAVPVPNAWDGKWRLVIFDIPEKYHAVRDMLRAKLKRMNFFRIQQSVWVHPYPCKKEIESLAEYYFLTDKIFVFEDFLTHDEKLCAYFKRKGISVNNAHQKWKKKA